jgi:crotonobetainyl-CoA:carnitine CoA-transferase CaiB-like acyl-CoA transferase
MHALKGIKVISLAVNLPGPAMARRLHQLGAQVIKVEPPGGDPMSHYAPDWYSQLVEAQEIITIDLKSETSGGRLDVLLQDADLLITASRPAALARLGLGWKDLHQKYPNLCHVAIVGYPPPLENEPGHDLTYQAKIGLLTPPFMPRTLIADMAGAERGTSEGLALLLAKERGQAAGFAMVPLSEAADYMAEPFRAGVTAAGSILGGGIAEYNLYKTSDGWLAVAALEPHFKKKMFEALNITNENKNSLDEVFAGKSAAKWEKWAKTLDLPIVAVKQ